MGRFAVQNLKANHNKDYSVVKTFSADVLSLLLGHSFSFCTIGYGVWVRNRGKQKALRNWFLRASAERTRFELVVGLLLRQFSKLVVSATHPPLQWFCADVS